MALPLGPVITPPNDEPSRFCRCCCAAVTEFTFDTVLARSRYLYTYVILPKAMFEKYGWVYTFTYVTTDYYLFLCLLIGLSQGSLVTPQCLQAIRGPCL